MCEAYPSPRGTRIPTPCPCLWVNYGPPPGGTTGSFHALNTDRHASGREKDLQGRNRCGSRRAGLLRDTALHHDEKRRCRVRGPLHRCGVCSLGPGLRSMGLGLSEQDGTVLTTQSNELWAQT